MLGKVSETKSKIEIRSRLYYNCQHLKTIKIVWVFLEIFFKKKLLGKVYFSAQSPWRSSLSVRLSSGVVLKCGKQTLTDLSLLKAMSSAGVKPRSRGCTGALSHSALPRTVHFLLLMSYPVLSRPNFTCHKWVYLVLELCNLRSLLK